MQAELRVEEVFWRVAMKPGRPVAFGMRRDHPVFNLPGNPVSALVCFELLVRPAVNALLGIPDPLPVFQTGTLLASLARNSAVTSSCVPDRSGATSGIGLRPVAGQDSHMIVSAAQADALVRVPRGPASSRPASSCASSPFAEPSPLSRADAQDDRP